MLSSAVALSVSGVWSKVGERKGRTFEQFAAVDLAGCEFEGDDVSLWKGLLVYSLNEGTLLLREGRWTYLRLVQQFCRYADCGCEFAHCDGGVQAMTARWSLVERRSNASLGGGSEWVVAGEYRSAKTVLLSSWL